MATNDCVNVGARKKRRRRLVTHMRMCTHLLALPHYPGAFSKLKKTVMNKTVTLMIKSSYSINLFKFNGK